MRDNPAVDVAALARAADLDLSPERIGIVRPILEEWRPGCLDLGRKMSDPARRHLVPVTVLVQGEDHG